MKKLNNKGFTLVELLAVVVILAVVMGIAMSSVLSSMNNSRKGSLQNSAESAAQIFQNKYAEAMVMGNTTSVLGAYNFSTSGTVFYPVSTTVASDLNLSSAAYKLAGNANVVTGADIDDNSFVAFNGEKIVVCLIAQNGGSYYVGQAAVSADDGKAVDILGTTVTFDKGVMFACSNEQTSW